MNLNRKLRRLKYFFISDSGPYSEKESFNINSTHYCNKISSYINDGKSDVAYKIMFI